MRKFVLTIKTRKMNKITEEIRNKLRAPLPKEAISKHPTKTFLSTIKPIYVVERLNDVFGIGAWFQTCEIVRQDSKMIVVKSFLKIPEYGIELEAFGGNDNADLGDAYKGAVTDALTKMCSYLEIGIDVFKGLADKPEPKQLPELQPMTDAWYKVEVALKKGYTIEDVKKKYKLSSENELKLKQNG